jgi:gluconokinase
MNDYIAQPPHIEHIWIITGPAGCGKTTVAQYLARELSLPYVEGDDV